MNAVTEQCPTRSFSRDSAAEKVKQLIEEEGNPELKLRVFVTGGGLLGLPVRLHFRRGGQRRRHDACRRAA